MKLSYSGSLNLEIITLKSSTPFRTNRFSRPSSFLQRGQRSSRSNHLSTQEVQPMGRWQQPEIFMGLETFIQMQHLKLSFILR